MKVLLIDDLRTWETDKIKSLGLPKGIIAKNYSQGIRELKKGGWDVLLLDHDLGEEKDGMNILDWLEEKALENQKWVPKKIIIVTDNAAERNMMKKISDKITNVKDMEKFRERLSKVKSKIKSKKWEDKIPGGMADKNKPKDFDKVQLDKGVSVEMEHTNDPNKALEIAMDHLAEFPDYYDRLEIMEEKAKLEKRK